jgi:tripartite-type tricarboxylate transporter receptor subunit TctC
MKFQLASGLILLALGTVPIAAHAQQYPTKPIRIYTAEAGGNADITARLIADHAKLGQPMIVVNKPSLVSIQTVADAPADGYSLLVLGKSFYLAPIFQATTSYDPVKGFVPVSKLTTAPNVLVVHPSLPATVPEIIALAKAKPGVLNYATGASGGAGHLAAELFKDLAGIDMVRIVYKGGGPSMIGVMSNESQLAFGPPAQVAPMVESGKVKAIAVTSLTPSEVMPGLPTIASVLPGYEMTSTQGIWATANTPPEIVEKLNQEMKRILELPEVKKQILTQGADATYTTAKAFDDEIKADIAVTKKLMTDSPGEGRK